MDERDFKETEEIGGTQISQEELVKLGFKYMRREIHFDKKIKNIYFLKVKDSFDNYPMYLYFGFDDDGVIVNKLLYVEDEYNNYDFDFGLNINTIEEVKALITLLK